jgi:hypothetical protein
MGRPLQPNDNAQDERGSCGIPEPPDRNLMRLSAGISGIERELWNVATLGQPDENRIICTVSRVVLFQRTAKPGRRRSNRRLFGRIKILFVENNFADTEFLQFVLSSSEALSDNELKKYSTTRGPRKRPRL